MAKLFISRLYCPHVKSKSIASNKTTAQLQTGSNFKVIIFERVQVAALIRKKIQLLLIAARRRKKTSLLLKPANNSH